MKKLLSLLLALAIVFLFMTPTLADAGEPANVKMNVHVADGSHYELPVDYIFSLESATRVANITVVFEVDGAMLEGGDLTFLTADFSAMDDGSGAIAWTQKDGGIWQGELLIMYLGDPNGFTATIEHDIFKLSYRAKQLGSTTLRVTEIRIVGFDETGQSVFLTGEAGQATTLIALPATLYSIYDLNKDGLIDERDLAMAQRYYMIKAGDGNWTVAQACDFNGDGVVDMLDLIELFQNFGVAIGPDIPPGAITMNSLPAINLVIDGTRTFNVTATASNGQAVQITARSENTDVATVTATGAAITVNTVAIGTATIAITASAPNCLDVVRRFTVTVTEFDPDSDIAYTSEEGRRGFVVAAEGENVQILSGPGDDVYFRLLDDVDEFRFAEVFAASGIDVHYAKVRTAQRQIDGTWLFTDAADWATALGGFTGEESDLIGSILPDAVFADEHLLIPHRIGT